MGINCHSCAHDHDDLHTLQDQSYRRILWLSLVLNLGMFLVEILGGVFGDSLALRADAVDFLSDGLNYAITLIVLGMSLKVRASAALLKGISMGVVGVYVFYVSVDHVINNTLPRPEVMGVIGFLALLVNVGVAILLYRHRDGDANRQSIWICSRNDAIGNICVILAGGGVWGIQNGLPDIIVGLGMACLGLYGAFQIIRKSISEIKMSQN